MVMVCLAILLLANLDLIILLDKNRIFNFESILPYSHFYSLLVMNFWINLVAFVFSSITYKYYSKTSYKKLNLINILLIFINVIIVVTLMSQVE